MRGSSLWLRLRKDVPQPRFAERYRICTVPQGFARLFFGPNQAPQNNRLRISSPLVDKKRCSII